MNLNKNQIMLLKGLAKHYQESVDEITNELEFSISFLMGDSSVVY